MRRELIDRSDRFSIYLKIDSTRPAYGWPRGGLDPVICEIPGAGPIIFSAIYVRAWQNLKTRIVDWHATFPRKKESDKTVRVYQKPLFAYNSPTREKSVKTRTRSPACEKKEEDRPKNPD